MAATSDSLSQDLSEAHRRAREEELALLARRMRLESAQLEVQIAQAELDAARLRAQVLESALLNTEVEHTVIERMCRIAERKAQTQLRIVKWRADCDLRLDAIDDKIPPQDLQDYLHRLHEPCPATQLEEEKPAQLRVRVDR